MILIDTNVLVALVDPRDPLCARSRQDAGELRDRSIFLPESVLVESCYLLPSRGLRQKLREMIDAMEMAPAPAAEAEFRSDVFEWMEQYAEHEPDWADACLAVLCGANRRYKVWSYDAEFRTIWRRPDGSKIPLAVKVDG